MMRKIKLYYTESEAKIILRSLIRLKNELIRQGRYADIVDEVILLLVDAIIKRVRTRSLHNRIHTVFLSKLCGFFHTQTHYIAVQFLRAAKFTKRRNLKWQIAK